MPFEDDETGTNPIGSRAAVAQNAGLDQLKGLLPLKGSIEVTDDHIQSILSVRRGRKAIFGARLFSDPAWDIILELYGARLAGRQVSAADLYRGIGVPESVVRRWIAVLVDEGLVSHQEGPGGGCPTLVLSTGGAEKMTQLAGHWCSAFSAIRGKSDH